MELGYGAAPQRVETTVEFNADDPVARMFTEDDTDELDGRFPVKLAGDIVNSNLHVYFYDRFVDIPTKSEIIVDGRVPGALDTNFSSTVVWCEINRKPACKTVLILAR